MAITELTHRLENNLGFMDFPRDVTAQTREQAYKAYNEIIRGEVKSLCLNFHGTDYMNSAGIGLVISLVEDATSARRAVYAYGLGSHYRKLFSMVGLTERLTLVGSEDEARARAGQPRPADSQT